MSKNSNDYDKPIGPLTEKQAMRKALREANEASPGLEDMKYVIEPEKRSKKSLEEQRKEGNSLEDRLAAYEMLEAKKSQSVGTKIKHKANKTLDKAKNKINKNWDKTKKSTKEFFHNRKEGTKELWQKLKDSSPMLNIREKLNQRKLNKAVKGYEQAEQKHGIYSKWGKFTDNLSNKIDQHSNKMKKFEQSMEKADANLKKINQKRQAKTGYSR